MRSWGSLRRTGEIEEFGGNMYHSDPASLLALALALKSETPALCPPVIVLNEYRSVVGSIYPSVSDDKQLTFIQGSNEYQIRVEDFLYVMSSSQIAALIKDGQRDTIHKDQTTLEACFS